MAKKGSSLATAPQRSHPAPAAWRAHLDSIKQFHGFAPMPKQQRNVVVLDQRALPDEQPAVFSMRQTVTQIKLSGTSLEDPVEELVRSLPILKPTLAVARSVHEVTLLTADYLELVRLRTRCSLPQDAVNR